MAKKAFLKAALTIFAVLFLLVQVTFGALPRYEIVDLGTLGGGYGYAGAIDNAAALAGDSCIIDSVNADEIQVPNAFWSASELGWLYTPGFSYILTGVLTNLGNSHIDGTSPLVTLEVYDGLPVEDANLLRSAQFHPADRSWAGANFDPLVLTAGQHYFIGFRNVKDLWASHSYDGVPLPIYYGYDNDGTYPFTENGDVEYAMLKFQGTHIHPLRVPADYPTIQDAIDAAVDGDTVLVADGIYTGEGNRDIDFNGKAITVRSMDPNDPNIVAATIIDCNGTEEEPHRGFYFHNAEEPNSILGGFTIMNGYAPKENYGSLNQSVGGGIFCRGSHPTIINCIIKANTAGAYGGGICCWRGSSPKIINCNITDNIKGGIWDYSGTIINCTIKRNTQFGIRCGNGVLIDSTISDNEGVGIDSSSFVSPTIINCKISGNTGGGIDCFDGGDAQIINCLIVGNRTSANGGGINCAGEISHPTISNCTIVGNTADGYGGGIFCDLELDIGPTVTNTIFVGNKKGAIYEGGVHDDPYVNNCLFYENTEGDYYDNETSSMLVGANQINSLDRASANIDADPCFVSPGYWDVNGVWVDGDYHLLQNSPCIDAGDPNYIAGPNETDLDGKPRVINGRIDMGAYEAPIFAEARILPRTINLTSKGKWITAYIWLPEEYNVTDIDPNSVFLEEQIQPVQFSVDEQQQLATARFNREEVQTILEVGDIELTITGRLTDGTPFEAKDSIRVINKAGKK